MSSVPQNEFFISNDKWNSILQHVVKLQDVCPIEVFGCPEDSLGLIEYILIWDDANKI